MAYDENYWAFFKHYNVTEDQMSYLWEVFMLYGMTKGPGKGRSTGNHYFLQGLCQYHCVEWNTWKKDLTPFVKDLIKTEFPQFMVQDKQFETS